MPISVRPYELQDNSRWTFGIINRMSSWNNEMLLRTIIYTFYLASYTLLYREMTRNNYSCLNRLWLTKLKKHQSLTIKPRLQFEVPCRLLNLTWNTWRRPKNVSAETWWNINNKSKDEDNFPNALNDKINQASYQTFYKFAFVSYHTSLTFVILLRIIIFQGII